MGIPQQFSNSQLEDILGIIAKEANFDVDPKVRTNCKQVAEKYNKQSGELAFNAVNAMTYAAMKDKATLQDTIKKLREYKFPTADIGEPGKYMHPELRGTIARRDRGMTREDQEFFKEVYDSLGVKPAG